MRGNRTTKSSISRRLVPVPATTGGSKSILFGVANLGGGNVWAAGNTVPAGGNNRAFATHRS